MPESQNGSETEQVTGLRKERKKDQGKHMVIGHEMEHVDPRLRKLSQGKSKL